MRGCIVRQGFLIAVIASLPFVGSAMAQSITSSVHGEFGGTPPQSPGFGNTSPLTPTTTPPGQLRKLVPNMPPPGQIGGGQPGQWRKATR
jgi:hypothetical protein